MNTLGHPSCMSIGKLQSAYPVVLCLCGDLAPQFEGSCDVKIMLPSGQVPLPHTHFSDPKHLRHLEMTSTPLQKVFNLFHLFQTIS